jgi:Zn-finger nucleic acid-binding protein
VHAAPSSLLCARCDLPLFEGRAAGVMLLGCGECGGIWLDNANAQRAVTSLDAHVSDLASMASRHAQREVDRTAPARCAECRAPLRRIKTTRIAVEVDVCAEHGTWFDRDELGVVIEALKGRPVVRPTSDPSAPLNPAEIPNFRAGTSTDGVDVGLIAGGVFTVLGALLAASKS